MNRSYDSTGGSGEHHDIPGSVPVLTFGSVGSSIEPISGDLYRSCIPYPTALAPSVSEPTSPSPPVLNFGAWLSSHFEKFGKGGAFVPDDKYARCLTIARQWYDNPNLKKGSPGQEGTAKERAWLKERGWLYSPDCVAPDGTFRAEGLWAPPMDEGGQRRYVVRASEVQKVIEEKHQAVGHLKRDKCWPLIRSTYVGVPKAAVEAFPLFCPECVNANSPEAKISKRLAGGGHPSIHPITAKRQLHAPEGPRSSSLFRRQVNYKT